MLFNSGNNMSTALTRSFIQFSKPTGSFIKPDFIDSNCKDLTGPNIFAISITSSQELQALLVSLNQLAESMEEDDLPISR